MIWQDVKSVYILMYVTAINCSNFMNDVVPRAELNDLEYKLIGVMHSVDKWLEGDELNQDEVNRAITMREKTLKIVEELQKQLDIYKQSLGETFVTEDFVTLIKQSKQEVAREIFEEIENKLSANMSGEFRGDSCEWFDYYELHLAEDIAELEKKYIGEKGE